MDSLVYQGLCEVARAHGGMLLHAEAQALVERGIGPRLKALGLVNEGQYLALLSKGDPEEIARFLESVSTSFTGFFREPEHFEQLAESVTQWLHAGQRRFRFWSAAAASGEEPYSLAITLDRLFEGREVDWRILATDVSTRILVTAQAGRYTERQLAPVGPPWRQRYFSSGPQPEALPRLKRAIVFRRLNLAQTPCPMTGPLDAIFCRNVFFYLTDAARQGVVREAERLLKPGGLFFLGQAETLQGLETSLKSLSSSVHEKPLEGSR